MKTLLRSLIICVGLAGVAIAQPSNNIKLNILSPVVSTVSVFYERAVTDKASAQLGFFYTSWSSDNLAYSGFGITPEYRFYISGEEVMNGWYLGPYLRYQNLTLENESTRDEATLTSFGGGLIVGRQWLFDSGFNLDLFFGPNYSAGNVEVKAGSNNTFDVNNAFDGFGFRFGFAVGYAF